MTWQSTSMCSLLCNLWQTLKRKAKTECHLSFSRS